MKRGLIIKMVKKTEDEKRYGTIENESGEIETTHKIDFEDGKTKLKLKSGVKRGKLARAQGGRFELKARQHWEERDWILDKWTNNVDLEVGKLIIAKKKYNPFKGFMVLGTGFPDFIALKPRSNGTYDVIGVEVKMNGILSKEEKAKCQWYLDNGIFSQIFVSKKGIKKGVIEHVDFAERWGNK
tara:strand:- start:1075 stop:1626 length:552 start_codon:yes stop_codon:yes gene_type:complete